MPVCPLWYGMVFTVLWHGIGMFNVLWYAMSFVVWSGMFTVPWHGPGLSLMIARYRAIITGQLAQTTH